MFGISWIRRRLEQRFLRSLGPIKDGFLMIDEGQELAPTLQRCTFEVERYSWGFFPVFRIARVNVATGNESLQSLNSLKDGFLTVGTDSTGGPTLKRCTVELEQYLGGILPLFKVKEHSNLSLTKVVEEPIEASQAAFTKALKETPAKAILETKNYFDRSAQQRIGKAGAAARREVERRLGEFPERMLRDLIVDDRNLFRQTLLEKIGETADAIFSRIIKDHLQRLVTCIRQEYGVVNDTEPEVEEIAFPIGTCFFRRRGRMTLFVMEQPPMKRTIRTTQGERYNTESHTISLPYVVFFAVFNGEKFHRLHIFFRVQPLRSAHDTLLCPALSNIFQNFGICFVGEPQRGRHLAQTAENAVARFWNARFDLSHAAFHYGDPNIQTWAAKTHEDALLGLSFPWKPSDHTVASFMEVIAQDFHLDEKQRVSEKTHLKTVSQYADELSQAIAAQVMEECFSLTKDWQIKEMALNDIVLQLSQIIQEVCHLLISDLQQDIGGVLSEKSLRRAFSQSIKRTIEAVKASTSNSVAEAYLALLNIIQKG